MTKNEETLMPHQRIFYDYLKRMPESKGLHVIDLATGGGKTFVCLKYWCEEGHKAYKRLFFILPQHKNIHSAIVDFQINNKQANSGLSYIQLKTGNGLPELLPKPESADLLADLKRDIKRLVEGGASCTPKQQEKLNERYTKFVNCIEELSSYCGRTLDKDNLEKIGHIDSSLRRLLKEILTTTCKLKEKDLDEKDCIENIHAALAKVPSLDKIYPIVHFHECQTIFLTAAKTTYLIDPIVNPSFFLYNSRFVKDSLLIYDEFDADYQEIRNHLFNPKNEAHLTDLLNLFYRLLVCLKESRERMTYNPELDAVFQNLHDVADYYIEVISKVYADYGIQPCKDLYYENKEHKRAYIFRSPQCGAVFPNKVKMYEIIEKELYNALELVAIDNNQPKSDNELPLSEEDMENPQKEHNLLQFIRRILGILRSFGRSVSQCSEQLYKARLDLTIANENEHASGILPVQSNMDLETLFHFQISEDSAATLFKTLLQNLRMQSKKQTMSHIPADMTVFNLGAYLMTLHQTTTQPNYYKLDWKEILLTPERCLYNLLENGDNTLIALSATARIPSHSTNICLTYMQNRLGSAYHTLSADELKKFDQEQAKTLPTLEERPIIVETLPPLVMNEEQEEKEQNPFLQPMIEYPSFQALYSEEQWEKAHPLVAELHNQLKAEYRIKNGMKVYFTEKDIHFYLKRYYHLLYAVRKLIDHSSLYSGIYFCNNLPSDRWTWKKSRLLELSQLLTASGTEPVLMILNTQNFDQTLSQYKEELKQGKKRMLLTAYKTTSVGMNLVYTAPYEQLLTGKLPHFWENDPFKAMEKDIDLIALQDVSNYIMQLAFTPDTIKEQGVNMLNAVYFLMVMHYMGHISTRKARYLIQQICMLRFEGQPKNDPDFMLDRQMYKLLIIKQTVGRISRRPIKGACTYILIEEELEDALRIAPDDQSYSLEFRALIDYARHKPSPIKIDTILAKQEKMQRMRFANNAQDIVRLTMNKALSAYHDIEKETELSVETVTAQQKLEAIREIILYHPTQETLPAEGNGRELYLDIGKPTTSYTYKMSNKGMEGDMEEFGLEPSKDTPCIVDEQHVYLPELMRNEIVRSHFVDNQIPTTWAPGRYILPPYLMLNIYKGYIGEEALKAILTHLFPDDKFTAYSGNYFEVADLKSSNRKIAFDAKHYNPGKDYEGHADFLENMRFKASKLNCTVLFVKLVGYWRADAVEQIDAHLYAIPGLINAETGQLNEDAVRFIRKIYEQAPLKEDSQTVE